MEEKHVIWNKSHLNIEMIWKIWKKGKLNSEKIWKIKWWQTFVRNVIIEINHVIMKKNGGERADNQ